MWNDNINFEILVVFILWENSQLKNYYYDSLTAWPTLSGYIKSLFAAVVTTITLSLNPYLPAEVCTWLNLCVYKYLTDAKQRAGGVENRFVRSLYPDMELPIYEFEMSVCSWHWEWRHWVSNSLPMRSKYIAPMITYVPVCCAHGINIIPLNSNWLSAGQLLIEMSKGWAGES